MKLSDTLILHNALQEIAAASKTNPREFPMLVRLMVAENIRLSLPHAQDFVTQRDEATKQFQEDHPSVAPEDGEKPVGPDPKIWKAHVEEQEKLANAPVKTHFRQLYESDLKDAPLTVGQLEVLIHCGILKTNEADTVIEKKAAKKG